MANAYNVGLSSIITGCRKEEFVFDGVDIERLNNKLVNTVSVLVFVKLITTC